MSEFKIALLALALTLPTSATVAFDDPKSDEPPIDEPAAEPTPAADEMAPEVTTDEATPAETTAEVDTAPATGEAPSAQPATEEQAKLFDMALHYILIAKPDLVASTIQALFASGVTDEQLAQLVDERGIRERVDRALSRGRSMEGAGDLVSQLDARILAGTRATSRNAHRIEQAVIDLGGTMRQQMIARGRLLTAGEYAVPALLRALANPSNAKLSAAARSVLVDIKRLAVGPLCAALEGAEPETQRKICEVLGEIGYPSAEPYLLSLANVRETPEDVRQAAMRTYARLGGTSASAASQFAALARRYFDQTPALIPYPSDANNPVWEHSAAYGLVGTEIPTPLYCETMAIVTARKALALDSSSDAALSVFVAADLRRSALMRFLGIDATAGAAESDESAGEASGGLPEVLRSQYTAAFFATAAGAKIGQLVLGMAVDANDPMLAREAIAVLGVNASAGSLVTPASGRSPMVECLSFADRRVRLDAAMVLAAALPQVSFSNDSLVIPILASMVKSGGSIGAVIAGTEEDRQALASRIKALGIESVVAGGTFSEADSTIAPGQTIDLVVVQGGRGSIDEAVRSLRVSRSSATAPVVVITNGNDATGLSSDYESDARVAIFLASAPDAAFVKAVEAAVGAAAGLAIAEEEAGAYSARALEVLKLIAQTGSPVFDIRDAESTLVAALNEGDSSRRLAVAGVLALIPTVDAQRSLMDAALNSSDATEQTALLLEVATSARKFDNRLLPRQIESLRQLIKNSTGETADAAGAVHGALGLPAADVVSLITGQSR